MPTNSPNTIGTILGGFSAKRRAAKAENTAGNKTASAKRSTADKEIVYKELPNPFRQPEPPYIWIDYPVQNERLLGSVYVVRLGVGGAEMVEIAVDRKDWTACRFAAGYWWYDWSGIEPGKHTLVARMKTPDGRWFKTPPRTCDYRP